MDSRRSYENSPDVCTRTNENNAHRAYLMATEVASRLVMQKTDHFLGAKP